jgi:F-type H+-transporting ATPase subunit gamma
MATLRDIKRRIKAVQSTRKITKAMKMVAAAKFRKAQQRMFELRPYAERMNSILSGLAGSLEGDVHPLLAVRPRRNVEVFVITSDRGLCSAFNTNILKAASLHVAQLRAEGFNVTISAVGRKAKDYFKRRNVELRNSWTGISGKISYGNAQEIAADIIESYINETVDEVIVVYNEFKSAIWHQSIGNFNSFGRLAIFQQACQNTRQGQGTSVECVRQFGFSFFVFKSKFQSVCLKCFEI